MHIDPAECHQAMDYNEHQKTYKMFIKLTLDTIVSVVVLMALWPCSWSDWLRLSCPRRHRSAAANIRLWTLRESAFRAPALYAPTEQR